MKDVRVQTRQRIVSKFHVFRVSDSPRARAVDLVVDDWMDTSLLFFFFLPRAASFSYLFILYVVIGSLLLQMSLFFLSVLNSFKIFTFVYLVKAPTFLCRSKKGTQKNIKGFSNNPLGCLLGPCCRLLLNDYDCWCYL